ncbi:MAG: hypothetical protein ACRBCS_00675 [Cellvibrionaceae bacterium]
MDIVADRPKSHSHKQTNKETYRVVFWGQVAPDYIPKEVALAFARKFQIKERKQLLKLFTGKVVTLKRNLSEMDAQRYVSAIQELGGVCRIESEFKNYFFENETKERHKVNFLQKDFDMDALTLSPKY